MKPSQQNRCAPARCAFAAVLLALAALCQGVVLADIYKWVDEKGQVQYGDRPPPGVKTEKVESPISVVPAPQPPDTAHDKPAAKAEGDRPAAQDEQVQRDVKAAEEQEAQRRRRIEECQRNRGVDCEQEADSEGGATGYGQNYSRPPLRPPVMPPRPQPR
jgi:Domain of unknown function (DUF4124)